MTYVEPARLIRVLTSALNRRGVPARHSRWVAQGLVETSLRGIDTHGIRLFPTYLAELDGGRARAVPRIAWASRAPAVATMDAGGALGLVAGRIAAQHTVALARAHGVGAVSVRNSNHFGAASLYTLEMARKDVLGSCCCNSDALVAPFGGRAPLFGTNPLSLAARGLGEDLFCVDFATSQTSYSKIRNHRERSLPIPPGWALGPDGRDASETEVGGPVAALSPLGGHKGEGLGMAVQVLSALLAGEPLDHELAPFYEAPFDRPRRVAHLFLGFDVAAFTDAGAFRARLSDQLERVRRQPRSGAEPVRAPGDPEVEAYRERSRRGVPIDEPALSWLVPLATQHGVDLDLTEQTDSEAVPNRRASVRRSSRLSVPSRRSPDARPGSTQDAPRPRGHRYRPRRDRGSGP